MSRQLIVEADGGSRGNPGPAAYGSVVRDAVTGELIAELAEYIGIATNNVAEYRGALAGLVHAKSLDPSAMVEVRLDSKLVVEQMSGRWKIKHPDMQALALKVRAVFPAGQVTYTWVPRLQNAAADALANEALDAAAVGAKEPIARAFEAATLFDDASDVLASVEEAFVQSVVAEKAPNRLVGWDEVGPPTVTVMVRHGATPFSLEKRFSGLGGQDIGLAEIGIAQAQAAARDLLERGDIDLIVTSPLLRTRQTAAFIADLCEAELIVMEEFAECSFGDWDGYTFSEVQAQWPDEMQRWLESVEVAPPGGESFADVRDRVNRGRLELLKKYHGKRIVIVSHVTPIKLMAGIAVDAPLESVYRMELRPGSISSMMWFADGNNSLMSFSEASHLRGIDTFPFV
ncbi:MAG: bifunctional RNase H/acid phosphatase [Actinobacteria bacterium]|uniref:Unannotated protein n=1 Tax=freshwater metagenome TaxID=449393 RepID=A0A6J7H6A4_9ZZZZ|nr:bifunctional RNase H/acid phosphatase [Actinomycetota bacterium]